VKKELLLKETEIYVKSILGGDASGHDWWHIQRVRTLALIMARSEGADLFLVELAALLHDIDDWKLAGNGGKEQKAEKWLQDCGVENHVAQRICKIIEGVSFKGAGVNTSTNDMECKVLQDADRLDAMGAIGIARTFAYGGSRGRGIYDPGIAPVMHIDFEDYKKSNAPTINHFYEKLFLLRDRLHTPTAKKIAVDRHRCLEEFIERFMSEWNGSDFLGEPVAPSR